MLNNFDVQITARPIDRPDSSLTFSIHVRLGLDQRGDDFLIGAEDGRVQRRVAGFVYRVGISAGVEKNLQKLRRLAANGPGNRRFLVVGSPRPDYA